MRLFSIHQESKCAMNDDYLVIEPGRAERHYWRDLWTYRELFYVLAWRDVSVRYKQTVIGLIWALIRPLLTMVVFTIIFGNLANLPPEGAAPYALMVYAGLLPWQLFSTALSGASGSLVSNSNLIGKVYFPRLIVPASALVVAFIDFLIALIILIGVMVWYRYMPGWQILTLPLFVVMAFLASLGPGLWIASLNIKYRDFQHVVPFLIQFGLYVSPVGFSSSLVPESWRLLYSLNPVVGVIEGFRWAILGETAPYIPGFFLNLVVIGLLLLLGIRQFRRTEKNFADLI
jgi:lipopolysaccharide transport system permease protein